MFRNPIVDLIDRQRWIGRVGDLVAPAVGKAFAAFGSSGREVKDFLNGVWLGHPLHPVLTDIPVGAWTTALVCDVASAVGGGEAFDTAADASIVVGLAGAVGAAITGVTDWSDTDGAARRIGVVHGTMNVTATTLYVASLVMRGRRRRWLGRLYGLLGYGIAGASAYLGGALVYTEQIGVDHAFGQDIPEQFTPVLHERELKDGRPVQVHVGEVRVVLVRTGNRVHALADTCAHLGGPLSEGKVEHGAIQCPWHGSTFSLEDGRIVNGPTTHEQPVYECRIRGGQVEIRMPRKKQAAAGEAEADAQRRAAG